MPVGYEIYNNNMNENTQNGNKINGNGVKFLNKNWKVIFAIIGLIITWTTLKIAVGANTEDIGKLEARAGATDETLQVLLIGQAEMKTSLEFIKQYVKD